jgi:formylglycine-generating enzyme required for sulfatase activity
MSEQELEKTRNAEFMVHNPDARGFKDGNDSVYVYEYGKTTLINNEAKVIKGGSWADRAYWMSPGTRRFQNGNQGSSTVGFRLVMDRLGSPDGNNGRRAGKTFSNRR